MAVDHAGDAVADHRAPAGQPEALADDVLVLRTSRDGTRTRAAKSPRKRAARAWASMRSFLIYASALMRFFAGCESTTLATPAASSSTLERTPQFQQASMTTSLGVPSF